MTERSTFRGCLFPGLLAVVTLNACSVASTSTPRSSPPPPAPQASLANQEQDSSKARSTKSAEPPPRAGSTLPDEVETIDLPMALRLAGARNIDVEIMAEHLETARADVDATLSLFLPRLEVGVAYLRHDGNLQETSGDVFEVSRSSISTGPGVRLHLDPGEAAFERLQAKQQAKAAELRHVRTRAEVMVRSAQLYLDLLRAFALVDVVREAVAHSRAEVEFSQQMLESEVGLQVHVARAKTAAARDQQNLLEAQNALRRASVDLSLWLRLPPEVLVLPAEQEVRAVTLVDEGVEFDALMQRALTRRPDLRELEALERAADAQLSAARWRPWIPAVDLFAGYAVYGGGRNEFVGDFNDRIDAGAGISWSFEGMGFGEAARQRKARAQARLAALQRQGLEETIRAQVVRALENVRSLRGSIAASRAREAGARETLELVRARFEAGDAIQLEVLEAAREAAVARASVVNAVLSYNQAQHLLFYQVNGSAWGEE